MWTALMTAENVSPEIMYELVEKGVGSLGFPIVMTILCFAYIMLESKKQREQTTALRDEVKSLKNSIDNLNRGLIDILSRLTNK